MKNCIQLSNEINFLWYIPHEENTFMKYIDEQIKDAIIFELEKLGPDIDYTTLYSRLIGITQKLVDTHPFASNREFVERSVSAERQEILKSLRPALHNLVNDWYIHILT